MGISRVSAYELVHTPGFPAFRSGRLIKVSKKAFFDLISPFSKAHTQIEIAAYNLHTRKWIRISGKAETESSILVRENMMNAYPALKQKYQNQLEMFLAITAGSAILKLIIDNLSIT